MPLKKIYLFSFCLILTLSNCALALSPKKEYMNTPHDFRMKFENIKIQSTGGATINAWYFPSDLGDQFMIISHDGVGNMGSYLERVKILIQYGFSVIIYDYRGFGESSDFKIDKYTYVYKEFYDDFDAVYNYCEQKFHHELIAYGWGIGGGISLTRGFVKNNIAGIIADEPFVDFTRLKIQFHNISSIMTIPSGMENSDYNSINVVQKLPGKKLRGILYLHGLQNFLFSTTDMNNLMSHTNHEFKELYQFERSERMDNFSINESEYARQIYAFVLNL